MDEFIYKVQADLFEMQDIGYKTFHARLMPTVPPDKIIGIRTPILRKYAKKFAKTEECKIFCESLPHQYYEENNLHGFIISEMKDIEGCLTEMDRFLPYIDNWATCDMVRPKVFKQNPDMLLPYIAKWLEAKETYTVRFAIGMLMDYFLEEKFNITYTNRIACLVSDEYYIKMMQAWYFATALAKQWDAVIPFLEEQKISKWVHNKTIQKSVESYRITAEQKQYLKTLRI